MDKSISDSSTVCICCISIVSSHSTSLYSNPLSIKGDHEPGFDLISVRNGDTHSWSPPDLPGDHPLQLFWSLQDIASKPKIWALEHNICDDTRIEYILVWMV